MALSSNDGQCGVNVKDSIPRAIPNLHGNARGWDELRAGDWERTQQGVPRATFVAFVNIVLTLCDVGDSVVMLAPYYFNSYMSFWLVMMSKRYLIPMQAFVNVVLTLCDAGDSVVMFAPYYFNSYMTFQMTGVTDILVGPDELEIHRSKEEDIGYMQRSRMLARNRQHTYEYFMYDGRKHVCTEEGNHIFSFSKAYGMMPMHGAAESCTKVARRVFPVPNLRQISLSG